MGKAWRGHGSCTWRVGDHTIPALWPVLPVELAMLQLIPTLLLFIPIFSEEGRKSLLFPPSCSISRLGIQDAPRFAGGRWGKGCQTWLCSGDYLWPDLVPRLIPFATSFPPPTAPHCSWAGGGGRGKCCWQLPWGLILLCLDHEGRNESVRSLQGVRLLSGAGKQVPSHCISPCPAGAVQGQEDGASVPVLTSCRVTQILETPPPPRLLSLPRARGQMG